jgi:hypothetical protein
VLHSLSVKCPGQKLELEVSFQPNVVIISILVINSNNQVHLEQAKCAVGLQGFRDENQKNLKLILDEAEEKLKEYNDIILRKREEEAKSKE